MFASRRALLSSSLAIRQFTTTPARLAYTSRGTTTRYTTGSKTVARAATSKATGTGNPDIVDDFPTTADEIDVDALIGGGSGSSSSRAPVFTPARTNTSAVENGGGVALYSEGQFEGDVPAPSGDPKQTDWYTSYHGLSVQPFPKEVAEILMAPIDPMDVEMKPGESGISFTSLS